MKNSIMKTLFIGISVLLPIIIFNIAVKYNYKEVVKENIVHLEKTMSEKQKKSKKFKIFKKKSSEISKINVFNINPKVIIEYNNLYIDMILHRDCSNSKAEYCTSNSITKEKKEKTEETNKSIIKSFSPFFLYYLIFD